MQKQGVLIPDLPVVYVNCEDEEGAKDLLLRLNSNYGHMTKESVMEFIGDYEFDLDEYELPDTVLDFSEVDEVDEEEDEEIPESQELKEKYELIITCENAEEQEMMFYKLTDEGYNVKVSTM